MKYNQSHHHLHLLLLLQLSLIVASTLSLIITNISAAAAADDDISSSTVVVRELMKLPTSSFDEAFTHLFGPNNLILFTHGQSAQISLDKSTGSGFVSHDLYLHGFFSASIKLPPDYTAGVVVAFYMSNGDMFEQNHDEIDFEFLGNIRGKEWRVQTNVYGNGSTSSGREERYELGFDPSDDFHRYSILWTQSRIVFYVDEMPIREVKRSESMGGDFPAKPMSIYATIWDGSGWATSGGRYKVNYKLAPYVAEFSDFVLHGCSVDPIELQPSCENGIVSSELLPEEKSSMEKFRLNHVTYSYCYDRSRYPIPLPECEIDPVVAHRLGDAGAMRFNNRHGHGRHRRHVQANHVHVTDSV